MPSSQGPRALAAVDLGSNSFHLVVARASRGQLHVLDRLRDRVGLAEGLDRRGRLSRGAQQRALACLARFGQRLRGLPAGAVRAVGTSTLRRAANAREFLELAEKRLGHRIEIVSGQEEARLIYAGVAHAMADDGATRLVVDIGGGSTECIVGRGFDALHGDSLDMGCVSWTRRFFPDGRVRRDRMAAAAIAARLELETIERACRESGWTRCIGSSGTVLAVDALLRDAGWSDGGITSGGLRRLSDALVRAGHASRLGLPSLTADRALVLPGGVAILGAVLDALRVGRMTASTGALREGVLHDLLGRVRHEDVRERSIRVAAERHHVDAEHAARVERTALSLLADARDDWALDDERAAQVLAWAARLHEVGLSIAYPGHHEHGAYLVEHSHLPGFSREDQRAVAALVRAHRRRLKPSELEDVPGLDPKRALRLAVLLRLAVRLNRSRDPRALPRTKLGVRGARIQLAFPPGWLAEHPLTRADLEEEASLLADVGVKLSAR